MTTDTIKILDIIQCPVFYLKIRCLGDRTGDRLNLSIEPEE
jgi:hypothetical protein